MESLELPRSVDRPKKFLVWDWPEFMFVVSSLAFGMLLGHPLSTAGVAMVVVYYYGKYREGRPDMYVIHALYWFGLGSVKGRTFINPFIRHLLP